jgi:hypothetical protein
MTSLGQFLRTYPCPRCKGSVVIDELPLPDNTYELVCLQCANRDFPVEMEITINMIIRLQTASATE